VAKAAVIVVPVVNAPKAEMKAATMAGAIPTMFQLS
jgi:hypothetical protein